MTADRPMNILQVLEPSGGGSGRHFVDLCGGLAGLGHAVTAIYSPLRAEERFVNELKALPLKDVHSVNMTRAPSPSDFTAWRAINRIIRKGGPFDIIHGQSSKAGALTRLHRPTGKHIPRVYTPHAFRTMDPELGKSGRRIFGGIESVFGRYFTDALICVSEDEKRHAIESLKIPEHLLTVIVNGVTSPPGGHRTEIRKRLGVRPQSFVFGFVGRLSHQKAPERLIEAFRRIARDRPEAELVMIGSGPDEDKVRKLIAATGVEDRIHLTTEITGSEAMQAFDVLVMPSRYEAMSYVMLEAASSGLAMILADVGGASTVLKDQENGYLIANMDNPSQLALSMVRIMDPQHLLPMRTTAADRKHLYSLDKMVDETEALYRSLIR
jgi:glycosyltransferase involved in cell wall biosynthesis